MLKWRGREGDPGRGGLQGARPRAGQLGGPASHGLKGEQRGKAGNWTRGEKRGRGAMGVESTLAVIIGTGRGPVKRSNVTVREEHTSSLLFSTANGAVLFAPRCSATISGR
eukprot:1187346-Prorocentrum_minimum.AAC.2